MDLHHNQQNSGKNFYRSSLPEVSSSFDEILNKNNKAARQTDSNDSLSNSERERLPILATSNDVREVVRFLKHKPAGLSLVEVLDSEPRRVFDARKIIAYEFWGIIERDDARIRLTALGNKLADIVDLENEIFKKVLLSVPVYLKAIEWIRERKLNVVTHNDITEYWKQLPDNLELNQPDDKNSEAEVVSFFSICHAAELGVATVGKRGQPARLRIDLTKVREFLSARKNHLNRSGLNSPTAAATLAAAEPARPIVVNPANFEPSPLALYHIYISTQEVNEITEVLCDSIELADFQSVISIVDSTENDYLQSSKIQAMQSCQAGIFIINDADCRIDSSADDSGGSGGGGGQTKIKNRRLMEISIATALFNRRVIIIWSSRLSPPEYLQNNLQIIIDNSQNFRTGFQAVKLLKNMNLKN